MWNISPFLVLETDSPGLTAGVALAADGLGLGQVASFNVDRTIGVTQGLGLSQSDYWIESVSSSLGLADTASRGLDRPFSVTQPLGLLNSAPVSGGQAFSPFQEVPVDGSVSPGQAVYLKATGNASITVATAEATASVAGVVVSVSGSTAYYLTGGYLSLEDWSLATAATDLTPGAPYYLDASTNGNITSTPPTGDGEFVVKVGRALNTKTLAIELGEGTGL